MHIQAKTFMEFIQNNLKSYFNNVSALDVGSGDINGNNRYLFKESHYEGNDIVNADNVTIVSRTKDLPFPDENFDTIISTECFEHDPEYMESLIKIYLMLKPGGLFCFTCASTGRREHGTRRSEPESSYATLARIEDMSDYYKNLTIKDINDVLNLNTLFSVWDSYYNSESKDLYFVGIKKGENNIMLPKYTANFVTNTSVEIT